MGSVEPMIINDVAGVSEFEAIPAVAVFRMRSYIGVPIVLSSGRVYGTLCALDRSPSVNSERELGYLLILAGAQPAGPRDPRHPGTVAQRAGARPDCSCRGHAE
jgi:hypothetical protein